MIHSPAGCALMETHCVSKQKKQWGSYSGFPECRPSGKLQGRKTYLKSCHPLNTQGKFGTNTAIVNASIQYSMQQALPLSLHLYFRGNESQGWKVLKMSCGFSPPRPHLKPSVDWTTCYHAVIPPTTADWAGRRAFCTWDWDIKCTPEGPLQVLSQSARTY